MALTDKRGRSHNRSTDAQAYRRWYGLKAWQAARKVQLAKQPLCERCRAIGRVSRDIRFGLFILVVARPAGVLSPGTSLNFWIKGHPLSGRGDCLLSQGSPAAR